MFNDTVQKKMRKLKFYLWTSSEGNFVPRATTCFYRNPANSSRTLLQRPSSSHPFYRKYRSKVRQLNCWLSCHWPVDHRRNIPSRSISFHVILQRKNIFLAEGVCRPKRWLTPRSIYPDLNYWMASRLKTNSFTHRFTIQTMIHFQKLWNRRNIKRCTETIVNIYVRRHFKSYLLVPYCFTDDSIRILFFF